MKKYPVLLVMLVLAAALCACGGSGSGNDAAIANPITETTQEEMAEETGISLSAPADASEVKYIVLDSGDEKKTSQVDFTYYGKSYTYRAVFAGGLEAYDMTGLHYDWSEKKDVQVGNCLAKLMLCDKAAGLYWIDIVPGINYSLGCNSASSEEEMLEVADAVFESLQASILANAVTIKNLAGVYRNGDPQEGCDQIELKDIGKHKYDFTISISGLAEITGTGNDMGGVVDIEMADPSGNEMCGLFFTETDGTYTLLITESTWDYLEEDSELKGFSPVE